MNFETFFKRQRHGNVKKAMQDYNKMVDKGKVSERTAYRQTKKYRESNEFKYKRFVSRETKKNPKVGANELKRKYRSSGKSIGNEIANKVVRRVKGLELDETKSTRNKAIPADRFLHGFIKNNYAVLMQYDVYKVDDKGNELHRETRHMYVGVADKNDVNSMIDKVFDAWMEYLEMNDENYDEYIIDEESIKIARNPKGQKVIHDIREQAKPSFDRNKFKKRPRKRRN